MYTYIRPTEKHKAGFTGYMVDEASTINFFDHTAIYRSKEFNEAMNYFDLNDTMTRNVLLAVNEADQGVVMTSLSNKLYQHIVDKVDEIDFGTIPSSQGDITKIDNYEELVDCVNIIAEILQAYHQPTDSINVIQSAIQNMIDRTDLFTKAYKLNVEMPMIIYNTMVLAIVSSVSYMISSCIEFIKMPDDQGFEIALNKVGVAKMRDYIVYQDLIKFNRLCDSGQFDKAMDYVIKQNANQFTGGIFAFSTAGVAVTIGILLLIIPTIRELIFFFYYSRAKASEYFDQQATLLTMNAYNIENNLTKTDKNKKEIVRKQKAIADKFKNMSNKLKVETKTSEAKASKEIKSLDDQKYKTSDVMKSVPDSAASVLF